MPTNAHCPVNLDESDESSYTTGQIHLVDGGFAL